jgi:hypothetical protein
VPADFAISGARLRGGELSTPGDEASKAEARPLHCYGCSHELAVYVPLWLKMNIE